MCRKFFWIKFEKKIRDRKSIDSQSLLSGLLDSNQRPRAPQTCALPTALNPDPFSRVQGWCKPNAENLFYAEVQLIFAGDFLEIACKGKEFF